MALAMGQGKRGKNHKKHPQEPVCTIAGPHINHKENPKETIKKAFAFCVQYAKI